MSVGLSLLPNVKSQCKSFIVAISSLLFWSTVSFCPRQFKTSSWWPKWKCEGCQKACTITIYRFIDYYYIDIFDKHLGEDNEQSEHCDVWHLNFPELPWCRTTFWQAAHHIFGRQIHRVSIESVEGEFGVDGFCCLWHGYCPGPAVAHIEFERNNPRLAHCFLKGLGDCIYGKMF